MNDENEEVKEIKKDVGDADEENLLRNCQVIVDCD